MKRPFFRHLFQRLFLVYGMVDGFQVRGKRFPLFVGDIFQRVLYHMYDVALLLRLRECRRYGFFHAREPVRTQNEDILHPPVLQLVQDGEPVLGAFILPSLYAQEFLFPFQRKAGDDTGGRLANHPIFPHGIIDRINVDYGIDFLQRAVLPVFNLRQYLVCHIRELPFQNLKTIDIHQGIRDLAGCHAFCIHGYDLLVNAGNVLLTLPYPPPQGSNVDFLSWGTWMSMLPKLLLIRLGL